MSSFYKISLFYRQKSRPSTLMILMMGVHSVFSSLWFPAVTSDAASGIVGCTAVAAKANRPQTTLWQQKPDLPVPWSLIISTKINAD